MCPEMAQRRQHWVWGMSLFSQIVLSVSAMHKFAPLRINSPPQLSIVKLQNCIGEMCTAYLRMWRPFFNAAFQRHPQFQAKESVQVFVLHTVCVYVLSAA